MRAALIAVLAIGCTAPRVELLAPAEEEGTDAGDAPLVVETWHTENVGRNETTHDARLDAIGRYLASDPSDVICLQGVALDGDRAALMAAAHAKHPYAYFRVTDRSTPVDDPRDMDGKIPAPFTTPPCVAADEPEAGTFVDCVKTCAADRSTFEQKCVMTNCAPPSSPRCSACMASSLLTSPLDRLRGDCFTRSDADLAFEGGNDVLLLSNRELSDVRHHLAPGWVYRSAMVEGSTTIDGREVVIACANVNPDPLPYAGPYGRIYGDTGDEPYFALSLALHRLSEIVIARNEPAVFLGTFAAGWALSRTKPPQPDILYSYLEENFDPLTRIDAGFGCTQCRDNALLKLVFGAVPDGVGTHVLATRGSGLRAISVERTATDPILEIDGKKYPPSMLYGLRATIH